MKRQTKKALIIKRKGFREVYDEKKVYASVYFASLNCHYSERKSEKIALDIMKKCNSWIKKELKNEKSMKSEDIRNFVLKALNDEDIVLMYKHHFDLS